MKNAAFEVGQRITHEVFGPCTVRYVPRHSPGTIGVQTDNGVRLDVAVAKCRAEGK